MIKKAFNFKNPEDYKTKLNLYRALHKAIYHPDSDRKRTWINQAFKVAFEQYPEEKMFYQLLKETKE